MRTRLLIPLLVFLPVVLSGALCADSLTEEVQRGTIGTLLSTPATPGDVIEGKLLANVAVTPILSVAWFGLLALNGLTVPVAATNAAAITRGVVPLTSENKPPKKNVEPHTPSVSAPSPNVPPSCGAQLVATPVVASNAARLWRTFMGATGRRSLTRLNFPPA